MLRKSISILLALVMIVSIFTIIPTSAAEKSDKEPTAYEANVEFVAEKAPANAEKSEEDDLNDKQDNSAEVNDDIDKADDADDLADTGAESDITVTGDTENGYTFTVSGKKATITGYNDKNVTALNIPDTLGGYPVDKIGNNAFEKYLKLTSVVIPDTVTSVEHYAFCDCYSLKDVKLSKGLKFLGGAAFKRTAIESIEIPKALDNADTWDGEDYEYDRDEYWIANGPFSFCENLKTVTFEQGTVEISKCLFYGCVSLEEITIPNTVKAIEDDAFNRCLRLKKVNFGDSLTSIGYSSFYSCLNLTGVNIPDTVTSVEHYAFCDCYSLKDVKLSKGLKFLGGAAFKRTAIESIEIPKALDNADTWDGEDYEYDRDEYWIANGPFSFCENLKTVTFEQGTVEISKCLFYGCVSLEEITIPNTVKAIEDDAFNRCLRLKKVNFGDSLTSIGYSSFYSCLNLTGVNIPDTVTSVEHYAFCDCYSLKDVKLSKGLKFLGGAAFKRTAIESIEIPKALDNADTWDGEDYEYDRDEYWIANGPFSFCENLKTVTFEQGTVEISKCLFEGCIGLEEIVLPDTIKVIEDYAFKHCLRLKRIYLGTGLSSVGEESFFGCNEELTFYSPKYSAAAICCIDEGYNLAITTDNRIHEPDVLDLSESEFRITSSAKLNVNCSYSIKDDVYKKASNYSVKIHIPKGASLEDGSLYLDRALLTNFTEQNDYISIPVTKQSGKISFNLNTEADCKLLTYAVLNYRMNNQNSYDIIDVINENIELISLNTEDVVSTESIKISGIAPLNADVDIYIGDKKAATLKANKAGTYSGEITLNNPVSGTNYTIKAVSQDNNGDEITAEKQIAYVENAPELTDFTMTYNGRTYDLLSGKKQSITFVLESFHGVTPFGFEAKYTNDEKIGAVYFTSTRNQVTKQMKATYNEATDSYIAEGFFDESNHDYVPGKINVQYSLKRERDHFNLETIDEEMNEPLPEILKDATYEVSSNTDTYKEILINLKNGEKITYTYEKLDFESFDEKYPDNDEDIASTGDTGDENLQKDSVKILYKILKKGWKYYKAGNKTIYYQVDGEEKSTTYWDFEQGKDYLIKESLEYPKKYFIENALTVFGGEELAPISKGAGYCVYESGKEYINYFGTAMDYNMAIAQIMASDLPEESKRSKIAYIQGLKMAAMNVAAAKMVGSYLKFAGGVVIGECPPLGIALYVAGYAMADMWAKDPDIFDKLHHKWNSINAFMMDFIIDPSGYVYAGVTSNRVENATVTAYWIPFDEDKDDDSFWDSPDESRAVLWDSGEYSQINPLFTDNDGNYAWDVPEGWWQVKVEKEGYETYTSEWLPVPPPQTDININLISTSVPELESAVYADGAITLSFSDYMKPATLNNIIVTDYKGNTVDYTLTYSQDEKDIEGNVFAKEYQLVFADSYEAKYDYYKVSVTDAESYTGKSITYEKEIGEKPEIILGDVDGDGDVTVADATVIQRYVIKTDTIAFDEKVADVDGDRIVTIVDATFIQRYSTNVKVPYDIGEGIK